MVSYTRKILFCSVRPFTLLWLEWRLLHKTVAFVWKMLSLCCSTPIHSLYLPLMHCTQKRYELKLSRCSKFGYTRGVQFFFFFFLPKDYTLFVVSFADRTCTSGIPNCLNYCATFYSIYIIYKCSRGPRIGPMDYRLDDRRNRISIAGRNRTCACPPQNV
jgi:hypothetical protein